MKTKKTTTRPTPTILRDRQRPRTQRRAYADFLSLCVYPGMRPGERLPLERTANLNAFFAAGPTEQPLVEPEPA